MVNDRLIQVEKGFIYPPGLPGRPDTKYVYAIIFFIYNVLPREKNK